MAVIYGGPGVNPTNRGQASVTWNLQPGENRLIPAGTWSMSLGLYTAYQVYDQVTGIWRSIGGDGGANRWVQSDGVNHRIANQNGCVVGAVVTNGGTGYTSAPTVTASAGNATFQAIVGGAVSTSVTVTNGGSNYTYAPIVILSSPGNPGVQATGYATISGGAVATVVITDQGAGYTQAPVVTFQNDPRDTTGSGAAAATVLTGAGTVTAVLCTNHGTVVTGTSAPTLSFSGGGGTSAAATAVMNWSITSYTVNSAGSGYAGSVEITAIGPGFSPSPALTNPQIQTQLVRTRTASILGPIASTGVTTAGQVVYDGGIYMGASPQFIVNGAAQGAGSAANVSFVFGGNADTVRLFPV